MSIDPYLVTPGIRFNDCSFTEPTQLTGWTPPKCAGLFGILVADPNWAPKQYQPLYFGEFGNNTPALPLQRVCGILLAAAKGKTLLVCVLPLPFSTTSQRWAIRNELVCAYNPLCQTEVTSAPLTELNRIFEPQPEPRRRSIGFLPQSEPAR